MNFSDVRQIQYPFFLILSISEKSLKFMIVFPDCPNLTDVRKFKINIPNSVDSRAVRKIQDPIFLIVWIS